MFKNIFFPLFFMIQTYHALAIPDKNKCAGYFIEKDFKPSFSASSVIGKGDITGDGIPDNMKHWGEDGTSLEINCGDGMVYTPIYSHSSIAVRKVSSGRWEPLVFLLDTTPSDERDTRTWIDGRLHFFEKLDFNANEPQKDSQIWFKEGRYTTDLLYCEAFDVYAPLYRVGLHQQSTDVEYQNIEYLTLLLKTGEYPIQYKNQTLSYYTDRKPEKQHINDDGIVDYQLSYRFDDGGSGGSLRVESILLGCGDDTYMYVPDHMLKEIIKRGK